jgi:hypothetical protein
VMGNALVNGDQRPAVAEFGALRHFQR